tara:strand:+ start:611 stop:817 length:207 start_codon:yes stop_codon:yes gene_type:complete
MIININSSQDRKEKKMSLKENLTFWDGVEMTLLFMALFLTLGFYLWEIHLSPNAREEKRKKKEKIKET